MRGKFDWGRATGCGRLMFCLLFLMEEFPSEDTMALLAVLPEISYQQVEERSGRSRKLKFDLNEIGRAAGAVMPRRLDRNDVDSTAWLHELPGRPWGDHAEGSAANPAKSVHNRDVIRTRTFFALANGVFDRLAFIQVVVAGALHRRMVKEQVAPITFDEAEAFVRQFLDFTLWHCCNPKKMYLAFLHLFNTKRCLESTRAVGHKTDDS